MTGERRVFGEVHPVWHLRLRNVSVAAAALVAVGGAIAVVGRILDLPILAQWVTRTEVRPMQPAEGILFILAGLSVIMALTSTGRWVRRVGSGVAGLVLLGGIAVIIANLANLQFPRWLLSSFEFDDIAGGERPGRPALNVGVVMTALAAAVILLGTRFRAAHITGQLLAFGTAMIGATVVVAFAYGDDSLRGFPLGSGRMPVSAGLLVVVLSAAVVSARPALGLVAPVISPWPGGIVLRRFLPLVLAGPPIAVALLLSGTTPESQPQWFALAAVVVSGLLLAALFTTASAVSRSERIMEVAQDITHRAETAVARDAEVVELLLSRLSKQSATVDGLDIAVRFRPAEGWLAGDSIVTVPLGGSRLAVLLIDVVGHGATSAIAAARLGDVITQTLLRGDGPAAALANATWVLDEPQMMASVAVVDIDAGTGLIRYASAGHPPLLHMTERGVKRYETTGPILLNDHTARWNEGLATLEPGESLMIFSDGLADPTSPNSVSVATVREMTDALQRCPYNDPEDIAEWCLDEALGRAEGVMRDDASLVVIGRQVT